jgi:hypothetical protein
LGLKKRTHIERSKYQLLLLSLPSLLFVRQPNGSVYSPALLAVVDKALAVLGLLSTP